MYYQAKLVLHATSSGVRRSVYKAKETIDTPLISYYVCNICQSVVEQHLKFNCCHTCSRTSSNITTFSAGMGQALVQSGWMMLTVLGVNHVFCPVQTEELGPTTVSTLKMWPFPVLVLGSLVPTAASLLPLHFPLLAQLSLLQVIQFHA